MILCVRRIPEEGIPVPEHVAAMILMNFVVLCFIGCFCWSIYCKHEIFLNIKRQSNKINRFFFENGTEVMYNILQINLISFLPKYMKRISYMPLSLAKQVFKRLFSISKINVMDARNKISICLYMACSVLREIQEAMDESPKLLL